MTVEIRPLEKGDDRRSFLSGDEALDLFFHRYAGQNHFRHHIGVTYIAVERETIHGFITVSPASLDADDVPTGRKLQPFPLPVLRIARLATDQRARGLGIGRALLRFGLELAESMRDRYGCVGVVVDATPDAVDFYARYGFTEIQPLEGASRAIPRPTPMFLALGSIPSRLEVEP